MRLPVKRLDTNAAVLPNSLARFILQRLDSNVSKSESSPSFMCSVLDFEFNLKILKRFNMGSWQLGAFTTVITWKTRPWWPWSTKSTVAWLSLFVLSLKTRLFPVQMHFPCQTRGCIYVIGKKAPLDSNPPSFLVPARWATCAWMDTGFLADWLPASMINA